MGHGGKRGSGRLIIIRAKKERTTRRSRGRGEEREWNANKKKDPSGRERVHEKNETHEVVFHRRQRHPLSPPPAAIQVYSYQIVARSFRVSPAP